MPMAMAKGPPMRSIVPQTQRFTFAACLVAMTAGSVAAQSRDSPSSNSVRFAAREGEVIYRTTCQACAQPSPCIGWSMPSQLRAISITSLPGDERARGSRFAGSLCT